MPNPESPLLARAQRASCYFDRKRNAGDRRGGGRWVSLVRVDDNVYLTPFETEAEARAHIGLTGGSEDPAYGPQQGDTGFETRQLKAEA